MPNTPSLFPLFLKSGSAVTGVVYGSSITTLVEDSLTVSVEMEIPAVVQPQITVTIEDSLVVQLETCD